MSWPPIMGASDRKKLHHLIRLFFFCVLMTKFYKYMKPFLRKKVVSKIVSTRMVVSTRKLAKLNLNAQNSCVDCRKLKGLIADFSVDSLSD